MVSTSILKALPGKLDIIRLSPSILWVLYCKFGNFRENFIFANSVKRHICDAQTSRLRHDLLISVNDRVILSFHEGLTFTKLRTCEVSRK